MFFGPREAEARALSLSLLWAKNVGLNHHTAESNALAVFKELKCQNCFSNDFGHLLLDVSFLLSYILGAIANHLYREANNIAHCYFG